MSLRLQIAKVLGAVSTGALAYIFRRPAANFPGKVALYADPQLIAHLRTRLQKGSIVVVGTNGKTTVTNLLADALEAAGSTVACNRTGANLDSGIATALLHVRNADWGVLECDELWFAKIAPQLKPDFVVLLNLFRDQLDRAGEIDHVQAAIAAGLAASPATKLVYNADDPFCQSVADRIQNECIPFGIDEAMHLEQNSVSDSGMCQQCGEMLDYSWHQYGQLGKYRCPACGFERAKPIYHARGIRVDAHGVSLGVAGPSEGETLRYVKARTGGAYTVYNLLAFYAAADCCGVAFPHIKAAIDSFAPRNGRLQEYEIDGRRILLNLAKNPTGFNQNLRIVAQAPGPKAVAFFINDKEADGRDISWLWDVDFQELASAPDLIAFAGGIRRNDLQVRLKYAGINAALVNDAEDFLAQAQALAPKAAFFAIANYTALPNVKAQLDALEHLPAARDAAPFPHLVRPQPVQESLKIVHLYPELLNLYGDGGNVTILAERARRRGLGTEVIRVEHGKPTDLETALANADIVFLGGGPDREQRMASIGLHDQADALRSYIEGDGVLLAICGGFQILGRTWLLGDESVPGLDILDIETKRAEGGSHNRLVGDIALASPLASIPVIGYENHAGRTYLGSECEPFGRVIGKCGNGNNGRDGFDGARYRNVLGTYLHGPLLAKNPEVADWLLAQAFARRTANESRAAPALSPLDDAAERAANKFMRGKLGI